MGTKKPCYLFLCARRENRAGIPNNLGKECQQKVSHFICAKNDY